MIQTVGLELIAIVDCSDNGAAYAGFTRKWGISHFTRSDLGGTFKRWCEKSRPDVFSVYALHFLLQEDIFSIPRFGTLNLHPSLLPRYPGAEPWRDQRRDGVKDSGYTVFKLDCGVDTGPIIAQLPFKINYEMSMSDFSNWILESVGATFFCKVIGSIETGMGLELSRPPLP